MGNESIAEPQGSMSAAPKAIDLIHHLENDVAMLKGMDTMLFALLEDVDLNQVPEERTVDALAQLSLLLRRELDDLSAHVQAMCKAVMAEARASRRVA